MRKKDVLVETDHQPLIRIANRQQLFDAPKRLQAMLMYLQRYNLKLKYVKGTEMYIADLLSRAPTDETKMLHEKQFQIYSIDSPENMLIDRIMAIDATEYIPLRPTTMQKIKDETAKDTNLQHLRNIIIAGWPLSNKEVETDVQPYWKFRDELTTQDGLILKGNRIVVPVRLRKDFLDRLHSTHQGVDYTTKLSKDTVFWPGISSQIRSLILDCDICLKYAPRQPNPPMLSHEVPSSPFERVSLDAFELNIDGKRKRYLVTVDHFSDFFEVDELDDLKPKTTINICRRNFSRHGKPEVCVTDNGTTFTSSEFARFAKLWEFDHITSSPNHQQGNGKAEATVKIAKRLMKKSIDSKTDFYKNLLQWRNTPNKTDCSPVQKLFSRRTRCHIPIIAKMLTPKVQLKVKEKIEYNRKKAKQYYDKKATHLKKLKPGDKVMVRVRADDKIWRPGQVMDEAANRSYIINQDGTNRRRSRCDIKHRATTAMKIENKSPSPQQQKQQITPPPTEGTSNEFNNTTPTCNTRPRRNILQPQRWGYNEL